MRSRSRLQLLACTGAVAVGVGVVVCAGLAGPAQADTLISFRTPSGNIGCVYYSAAGSPASLRCDIRSRLRPRPAKPPRCNLDWGDSYFLNATGRAGITCHGDTAILPNSRVLRYGTRWSVRGFACTSRAIGLRCRNRSGHGFFLSRQHSYRF